MPTAVLTGGSRGLGLAMATEFTAQGWHVITPSRQELDLLDSGAIAKWCAGLPGRVDALVHSAGVNWLRPVVAIDDEVWEEMLQVNLTALRVLVQGLVGRMTPPDGGRILALSSILSLVGRPHRAAYSSTKAAVNAFIRGIAVELGPQAILANALCPGYIDTDLTRQNNSPEVLEALQETIPLRRLGQPEDIAPLAVWLCSRHNTYVTGQTIVIDGGFTCQ